MTPDEVREINRPYIDVWRDASGFVLRKLWVTVVAAERDLLRFIATVTVQSEDNDGPQGGVNIGFRIEEPMNVSERLLWDSYGKRVLLTYGLTHDGYHKVIAAEAA